MCDQVEGPFNVTAPNPLRNREFVRVLAGVLNRLAIVPAPEFGLRLLVGEMADALLLTSCRVTPDVLVETGYTFRFDSVEQQLRYCLGKDRLESIE
jgi:NAD dependent epimerase/dehydratase family enzyme